MTAWDLIGVAALLLCVAVAVAIVKLLGWRTRPHNPPWKIAEERDARETRLRNPDWDFYERHLRRPVPMAIRQLFADRKLQSRLFSFEFDGSPYDITDLEPIDEQGLKDAQTYFGLGIVPFANSDGDVYYLRPGADETNAVYQAFFHEANDEPPEPVAEDVSLFVDRLRAATQRDA